MATTQIQRVGAADTTLLVSLTSLKKHVAIDATEVYYDDVLTDMQLAAIEWIESKARLTLRSASFDVFVDELPCGNEPLYLPLWPVTSVTSFAYVDEDGAAQTLATASLQIELLSQPAALYPLADAVWPRTQPDKQRAATIRVVAGGNAQTPAMVNHAIKLLVAHWFRNRETVLIGTVSSELSKAVDALIVQFRRNYWQSFGVYQ
jgi:uncharacterized phiE125 gp8 family phage protein